MKISVLFFHIIILKNFIKYINLINHNFLFIIMVSFFFSCCCLSYKIDLMCLAMHRSSVEDEQRFDYYSRAQGLISVHKIQS